MDASQLKVIGQERCENLRWKGLYIDAPLDRNIPEADPVYWCLSTQLCLGPDGQLVDHYACNPARPCYQAL